MQNRLGERAPDDELKVVGISQNLLANRATPESDLQLIEETPPNSPVPDPVDTDRLSTTVNTKYIRTLLHKHVFEEKLFAIASKSSKVPQFKAGGYLVEFLAEAFPRAVDVLRQDEITKTALLNIAADLKVTVNKRQSRRSIINCVLQKLAKKRST